MKCLEIFHKACVQRKKGNYKFVENHKIICCENTEEQASVCANSILEQTIHELSEDIESKDRYLKKMKTEMEVLLNEALRSEEEANKMIKNQEKIIEEMEKYNKQLEQKLYQMEHQEKATVCTQTTETRKKNKGQQTHTEKRALSVQTEDTTDLQVRHTSTDKTKLTSSITKVSKQVPIKIKKHILFVAGYEGKHISNLFIKQTDEFQFQSIIKPNASDGEIIKTAIQNSQNFTNRDIVIIWPKVPSIHLIYDFIKKLKHTNPIILSQPYQKFDAGRKYAMYERNIVFIKKLRENNLGRYHFYDCNSSLRASNYSKNGYHLKNIGKWYLIKSLLKHIRENIMDRSILLTEPKSATPYSDKSKKIKHSVPLLERRPSTPNQMKIISDDNHFLYPRQHIMERKNSPV